MYLSVMCVIRITNSWVSASEKKLWFQEKSARFEPTTFCSQFKSSTTWTPSAMVFKGILLKLSLYFRLQLALESKWKHTWACGNKLGVGKLWAFCVRHMMTRKKAVPGKLSAWQMDRQLFSYIFRLWKEEPIYKLVPRYLVCYIRDWLCENWSYCPWQQIWFFTMKTIVHE